MENKEMSYCEFALQNLHKEIRKAIFNGEAQMEFCPLYGSSYYSEMTVTICGITFKMTIADTFICYHNDFMKGLFSKKEDFDRLTELAKEKTKVLTPDEIMRINKLQAEIDKIKKGGEE